MSIALLTVPCALDCGVDDRARPRPQASSARETDQCLTAPDVGDSFTFAFIGDYGNGSDNATEVAALVKDKGAKFVVTGGDNGYGDASYGSVVGPDELYGSFLGCQSGESESPNYFWPSVGNHDVDDIGIDKYKSYFKVPRWYDVVIGSVHLFMVDSTDNLSDQKTWLKNGLENSTACHRIVVFHHAPYSSGANHGSDSDMQWDFAEWGATAVLSGHEHLYERIERHGILYLVNGLGGKSRYPFESKPEDYVSGSQLQYREKYGAVFVDVDGDEITYRFVNVDGNEKDRVTQGCSGGGDGGAEESGSSPLPMSCEGVCGDNAGGCWCDGDCPRYGDCCDDLVVSCGEPVPTPEPPPMYEEHFDGADGAPWPARWGAIGGSEHTAVLSNRGTPEVPDSWAKLSSSETGSSRMYLEATNAGADVDVTTSVVLMQPQMHGVTLYARHNGGVLDQTNPPGEGYGVYATGEDGGSFSLWREHGGQEDELAKVSFENTPIEELVAGTPYRMRLQCLDENGSTRVRAKIWRVDGFEPRQWTLDYNDEDADRPTEPGGFAVDLYNGGNNGEETTLFVDDFKVVDR
ncbi:MAG: metallophosphoesterase [Deltaproteobacteria bacterium]|nr:metallophosphoesterase [Deltaproteobacteria bacterium]